MRALLFCSLVASLLAAPASAAEPVFLAANQPPPDSVRLPIDRRGFSLPVIDYSAPDGSVRRKSGIIAGMEIGRGALLGVGMYQMGGRKRATSGSDPSLPAKRSRRMAVGISLQF